MVRFTLKQLEIFIAVAKHLNISVAAQSLNLSQPAVSQQIHKLELQLERSLFEFIGKKMYLTEEGKAHLKYAQCVIEHAEHFENACFSKSNTMNGTFKVAVGIPLQSMFFRTVAQFMSQHPSVNFEFYDGDRTTQLNYLQDNQVDFCLAVHPVNKMNYVCEKIIDLPMTFILSPNHRLANKKNITSNHLLKETFILCDEGSANYDHLHGLFKKMNYQKLKLIQINDQNAVKQAVIANLGIAVLPNYMLELEFVHGLLKPLIIDDYANRVTGVFWVQHAAKELTSLTQTFKLFLFNEFKRTNRL